MSTRTLAQNILDEISSGSGGVGPLTRAIKTKLADLLDQLFRGNDEERAAGLDLLRTTGWEDDHCTEDHWWFRRNLHQMHFGPLDILPVKDESAATLLQLLKAVIGCLSAHVGNRGQPRGCPCFYLPAVA